MKPPRYSTCAAALLIIGLTACGETYIDASATSTTVPEVSETAAPTVPPSATTDELIAMLAEELSTLSQAVVDHDDLDRRSDRIEAIWAALEPKLDTTTAPKMADVVDLAQTSIRSRRPADADKAYRLLLTATGLS